VIPELGGARPPPPPSRATAELLRSGWWVKRTLRGGALRVFAAPWCRLAAQRSSPLSTSGAAAPRKPAAPGGPGGRCCGLRKEESGASGRRSLGPPEGGVWGLRKESGAWRGAGPGAGRSGAALASSVRVLVTSLEAWGNMAAPWWRFMLYGSRAWRDFSTSGERTRVGNLLVPCSRSPGVRASACPRLPRAGPEPV
jgi:hypothetical protein